MTRRRQSAANAARSAGMRRYWRQVQAVQKLTSATSAQARRAVVTLRAKQITSAYAVRQHPRITARVTRQIRALPPLTLTPPRSRRRVRQDTAPAQVSPIRRRARGRQDEAPGAPDGPSRDGGGRGAARGRDDDFDDEPAALPPDGYADLDDWIDGWESYDGDDYDDYDVETNADYGSED